MGLLGTLVRPVVRPIRKYQGHRSRDFVLLRLPKHSIGAEIGVWEGNFSDRILHVAPGMAAQKARARRARTGVTSRSSIVSAPRLQEAFVKSCMKLCSSTTTSSCSGR